LRERVAAPFWLKSRRIAGKEMWSERLMYRGGLLLLLIFAMGSEALQDPTPSAGLGQHHLGSFDCPVPVGPQDCLEQNPRKCWWRRIAGPSKPRLRGGGGDTDAEAEEEITFPTASADATKEVKAVEEKPALDLRSWDPSYQQGKPTVWAAAKFGDLKVNPSTFISLPHFLVTPLLPLPLPLPLIILLLIIITILDRLGR